MNMKKKNKMNAFAAIFSAMLATVVAIALVSCDNDWMCSRDIPSQWRRCQYPNVS